MYVNAGKSLLHIIINSINISSLPSIISTFLLPYSHEKREAGSMDT